MRTANAFRALVAALLVAVWALPALAQDPHAGHDHGSDPHPQEELKADPREHSWDKEVVSLFERLPVQDGGRVKPLGTLASVNLLRLNGVRKVRMPDGGPVLSPTEWLLDVLFFPRVAIGLPCFIVDNTEALDAIGLKGEKRRDRFNYVTLYPVREQIARLAREYSSIETKYRTAVQAQTVDLHHNLATFESLAQTMQFANYPADLSAAPRISKMFGGVTSPTIADLLRHPASMLQLGAELEQSDGTKAPTAAEAQAISSVLSKMRACLGGTGLAMFPPLADAPELTEYLTPAALANAALHDGGYAPQVEMLGELESLAGARGDPAAFLAHTEALQGGIAALAEVRGEYGKIGLEIAYHRLDFVYYSLMVFVAAFLVCGLSWAWPKSRFLVGAVPVLTTIGVLYLTVGIVVRCVLRGRPPVSTLYETILFIAAVAVMGLLFIEWINRKRIAIALAAVLGMGGMFMAMRYELHERTDTMPSLVAVLDTNFWLATHVTTVTIGYAAGLMAAAVGTVYIGAKGVGLLRQGGGGKAPDPGFMKTLSRMTYGLICFGLLFSVVGTVLGGIWANDSWGRFWGWDPKENGALLIVLAQLVILHSRMGGYIKDHGLAMLAVALGPVVAFSWWGVNLLGVGLHSYGFATGIQFWLNIFYAFSAVVLFTGGCAYALSRLRHKDAPPPSSPPTPPVPPSMPAA